MSIKKHIDLIEKYVTESRKSYNGLPEDVLFFVSRMTPIVNIDLLIKDKDGRILLTWRDTHDDIDGKDSDWPGAGTGWHLPGGIVRYKEKLTHRVLQVMVNEIGAVLKYNHNPIDINELILEHETRGHFISFLYECEATYDDIKESEKFRLLKDKEPGQLKWHDSCPDDLITLHDMYRKHM